MVTKLEQVIADLVGERPSVDQWVHRGGVQIDTYAGRVQVEWDSEGASAALGHVAFFVEYLKTAGLFDAWVSDCPLAYRSPHSPAKRDVLRTVLLSILAWPSRYARVTAVL